MITELKTKLLKVEAQLNEKMKLLSFGFSGSNQTATSIKKGNEKEPKES